ncbi:BLOC-1-related complex subunit 6 isoform X1 [Anoplophora glabripennis]|uniref:BLOC-1-related complex subunit 6 isoform X1 n=1 Tax=Anoplophora glabripennis TaxID=217634 RepID=UPI0008737904|nr:BLOC-1-related complex subunit 6 isoform X1 [Anoplophora glabripennis]
MDSDEHSTPSPPPPTEPAPKLPPPLPARPSKPTSQPKPEDHFDADPDIDDDDISQQMTQSYSEISFKSGHSPENEVSLPLSLDASPLLEHIRQRPMTLPCEKNLPSSKPLAPLTLEGTVHVEGNMTHFVTEDLEHKIRLSSPVSKKDAPTGGSSSRICTPSPLYRQLLVPQVGQIDTALINDLECEAHRMATSIDSLIENLCGILHSISSITADNVDVYKNAVSKMSDAMDSNIKSMYTMMAKAEEVTQSMKIVEGHAIRIKEIKRLVDLFESFI